MVEILDDERVQDLDQKAQEQVEKGVEFAEASPDPDLATLTEYVYA